MNLGDTFLWYHDSARRSRHLFIAVTDPQKNDGYFATFNATFSKPESKAALTLPVGSHPFLDKYPSDIAYGEGSIIHVGTVEELKRRRKADTMPPMDMKWVELIAKKAIGNWTVPEEVEEYVKREWKSLVS